MKIVSTAVAILVLAVAGTASAQTAIRVGETVSGDLSTADPRLEDDSHYDCFALRTRRGVTYAIEMRSSAFDTYLGVGREACGGEAEQTDDDGAGGTDSRVRITGDGDLIYIRANSLSAAVTGPYRLSVVELLDVAPPKTLAALDIGWGSTVQGQLSRGDAVASDGSFYDCFAFSGQQGQRALIDMRSEDFDTYLSLYRGGACEGEQLESNDDGADGTDSHLDVVLPASGAYAIRANSLSSGDTGAYSLTLGGASGAAAASTSSASVDLQELRLWPVHEACLYRPGARRFDQATGRSDGRQSLLLIDGREVGWPDSGYTQADGRDWYRDSRSISIGGRDYVKYGLPRILNLTEVKYFTEHDGVVFAVETGYSGSRPEVLYALTRSVGCEFQPYQIED